MKKQTIILLFILLLFTLNLFPKEQCLGITKKGAQCKRFINADPPYCYQHDKGNTKKKKKNNKSSTIEGPYKVLKITDGDTFGVDINKDGKISKNEKVRLLGVDTFETRKGKRLKKQADRWKITENEALKLGNKAKAFAITKLLNKQVKLEYSGARKGGFGRILAYVIVDGKDFSSMLLKNKLAFVYRKNKKHKNYNKYVTLEKF